MREMARFGGAERIAVHDFDGRADRVHMGLRQRSPAPADRIEHGPRELAREAAPQNFVDLPLRRRNALGQHGFHGQGSERHADPAIPNPVVDCFRDFEAAAAHVADGPHGAEESGNDAERRKPRFLGPAKNTHLQTHLRLDRRGEHRPVRSATHGLRRHRIDSAHPHRLGNSAKSPHSLDCATKMVGSDFAGFRKSFRKSSERLFIEARHRRTAELVIDQEPDRVRADVDDCVRASVDLPGALGVELERPQRLLRRVRASPGHRVFSPPSSLSQANGGGPPTVPCPRPLRLERGRLSQPSAAPPGRA